MSNTLISDCLFAQQWADEARKRFAERWQRLKVAEQDLAYYRDLLDSSLETLWQSQAQAGSLWLALINSGLSHGRVLAIIRHAEQAPKAGA